MLVACCYLALMHWDIRESRLGLTIPFFVFTLAEEKTVRLMYYKANFASGIGGVL